MQIRNHAGSLNAQDLNDVVTASDLNKVSELNIVLVGASRERFPFLLAVRNAMGITSATATGINISVIHDGDKQYNVFFHSIVNPVEKINLENKDAVICLNLENKNLLAQYQAAAREKNCLFGICIINLKENSLNKNEDNNVARDCLRKLYDIKCKQEKERALMLPIVTLLNAANQYDHTSLLFHHRMPKEIMGIINSKMYSSCSFSFFCSSHVTNDNTTSANTATPTHASYFINGIR